MSDAIIRVENLSKCYRIGAKEERYKTIRETIIDYLKAPLRNFRQLKNLTKFETNNFSQTTPSDITWALKDVSFEVKQGDVLGVIGRNGAGKTTLLKIFSRITEPTSGDVKLYGRVGELLEVGIGFHPELTGRENIYLYGAILGMRKAEIDQKFDEIVDFAEIERFIDTTIKRYSSGMYVRLAFSVAAHLEPEIMLVDEVLSVGDMAFQKKCLKKINNMRAQAKAIVIVSHNMISIRAICTRVILLSEGKILTSGVPDVVVPRYERLMMENFKSTDISDIEENGMGQITINTVKLINEWKEEKRNFELGEKLKVVVEYIANQNVEDPVVYAAIRRPDGFICVGTSTKLEDVSLPSIYGPGIIEIEIPELLVIPGYYIMDVTFYDKNFEFRTYFLGRKRVGFQVRSSQLSIDDKYGVFYQKQNWKVVRR